MKNIILVMSVLFCICLSLHAQPQRLKISQDQRHIVYEDNRPFFWLGDTAWELFHRTTQQEADLYLENRAAKGFTVIQAVVLAELDGLNDPSSNGTKPLLDNDPARPNEKYFEHVDYIVNKVQELGLFIGMLPTWGDKWNKQWGVGPDVFTPENAYQYGAFLGARYKENNIIWILGGDRKPDDAEDLAIIRAMAKGLQDQHYGTQLMTFHPMGGWSSSEWFHQDDWLDINMFQSGHGELNNQNYRRTAHDYNLSPIKPALDGEPCYEDHPINWRKANGWFDEFDSRRAGYWSMLEGACGHTYGNHNIWQMWLPGRQPISQARTPWKLSLDYPGAFQAGYMRKLFESRPWQLLQPASNIIQDGPNTAGKECRAAVAADGSFLFVYTPYGTSFRISTDKLYAVKLQAWWFDTSTGTSIDIGELNKEDEMTFDPPADEKRGNDWLLVLEDADKAWKKPGE
ncbi:glycoside hydrolase family 140 protein [candidate division KSB1 bacterium]|nr:glycoside hydrolase family 140 protein [candidate division KSB1 bacterium]